MFPDFKRAPDSYIEHDGVRIPVFHSKEGDNLDKETVRSFGQEWRRFHTYNIHEIEYVASEYFDIVPPALHSPGVVVLDIGCGNARWSEYLARRGCYVDALDPSIAVYTAAENLKHYQNARVVRAGVSNLPYDDESFDFIISLGVLHHVPDTELAICDVTRKLKVGGQILLYLYYALDNRGVFFRLLYQFSDLIRRVICVFPQRLKVLLCDVIAFLVYLPLIWMAKLVRLLTFGSDVFKYMPLSYYHDKSLKIIRNDALDRFGTPLEHRFTKAEISELMKNAGLTELQFSNNWPFWHVIGVKR